MPVTIFILREQIRNRSRLILGRLKSSSQIKTNTTFLNVLFTVDGFFFCSELNTRLSLCFLNHYFARTFIFSTSQRALIVGSIRAAHSITEGQMSATTDPCTGTETCVKVFAACLRGLRSCIVTTS